MDQYRSLDEVRLDQAWVTIGTFDGVHLGHQAILRPMAAAAHAAGNPAVVVTFYPNPVVVLRGVQEPMELTPPDERARLMGALGIDAVVTLTFNRALANQPAEEFMQGLHRALGLRQLWVGHDFALGHDRQGDIPTLQAIGERLGYRVHVTGEVLVDGQRISSRQIRDLVRRGEMRAASRLLGRPYAMQGPVVHGDDRGRQLGFPTANVNFPADQIVPAFGVYATWFSSGADEGSPGEGPSGEGLSDEGARRDSSRRDSSRRLPSVTNVGLRPTFDPPILTPRVESYVIDFDGDLYGQTARVEFLDFLRPELKFDSAQALIDQMALDTQQARETLSHAA
jgi:riboflavin kinase/FMN adenylyltransferase